MTVNIYLSTTAKKPINATAGIAFVIECETSKGPATLSHSEGLRDISRNQAEIYCLAKALQKLNKPCEITVFAENGFTVALLNDYLAKWEASGWHKSNGQPVDPTYKNLKNLLNAHKFHGENGSHSYSEWLKRQAEAEAVKEEEKRAAELKKGG